MTSRDITQLIICILLAVAGRCGVPVEQTAPAPASVQNAQGRQTSAPSPTPETFRRDEQRPDGSRQKTAAPFQGTWSVDYNDGGFDLLLIQEGENLYGYHWIVAQRGNKVDNSDPDEGDEPTIVGKIKGNIAFVDFSTVYDKGKDAGKAKITLKGSKIRWEVIKPMIGWNLYPDKVVLRKISDKTRWEIVP